MARRTNANIAINLYNVRDHTNGARQIARTLRRLRKIGFENVQCSGGGLRDLEPAELRAIADDAGVAIVAAHISLPMLRDDSDRTVDMLHTWGTRYVGIGSAPQEEWQRPGGWQKLGRELTRHGRKLADDGLTLQYHNHHFEFTKVGVRGGRGGRCGLEILYASSDGAYLQSELDVGWVARAGADPTVWLLRLKGRVDQVHIKDWGVIGREAVWMPLGEGNMNWPPILKACRQAGTKYYIYEQDNCPTTRDEFRAAEISYGNMRELGLK
jgi:sugar phosphate isomerase/epimerase